MGRLPKISGCLIWSLSVSLSVAKVEADDLKGHLQETNLPPRIARPVLPPSGALKAGASEQSAIDAKIDASNFDVHAANAQMQRAQAEMSRWNPWASSGSSRLTARNQFFKSRYQSPLLTGSANDYAAVERAWGASTEVSTTPQTRLSVRLTVALCRPGGAAADGWNQLMLELSKDDGAWRTWQDNFCRDILAECDASYLPYGSARFHISIDADGKIDLTPRTNQASDFELACHDVIRRVASRYRLPAGSKVPFVHAMININETPSTVGKYQRNRR